jgi:hypothetical protein
MAKIEHGEPLCILWELHAQTTATVVPSQLTHETHRQTAAQHSSSSATCISAYMLEQRLERIRKCFCGRTNHTKHRTILQWPTVIKRTDKTTLRAWQDHDCNSREGQTRLHVKRDCHPQTTDYNNLQR